MCGITGYTGSGSALPFLLQGMKCLEYRGYDSAGITLVDASMTTWKAKGRITELEKMLDAEHCPEHTGIGHTRWATHGVPSQLNAHPHNNMDDTISIIHNGIIENYVELKRELTGKGYVFSSQTDSEVVVHLIDDCFRENGHDMLKALETAVKRLQGSFALCIVTTYEKDKVYCAKKESPLVLGHSAEGSFCASDPTALLAYTREILAMEDGQIAVLTRDRIELYDFEGNPLPVSFVHYPYDAESAQQGGYDSFMRKEIHEQPDAIRGTLRGRFDAEDHLIMDEIESLNLDWDHLHRVYFIACGTAYHASIYGRTLLQRAAHISCIAEPASEFRYEDPIVDEHTLCIFVSQSGETADTLAAVRLARERHAATIALTNVLGSSISRMCDATIYTCAGPEIAVASTKAYTTQLVMLVCIDLKIAEKLHAVFPEEEKIIRSLKELPQIVEKTLDLEAQIEEYAGLLVDQHDAYFIGRQLDYPTALEGALKLKEISYVHADAYYAGELKHGPIALIEPDTVVVAIATQKDVASKTFSNMQETLARGANVIFLTDADTDARDFRRVVRIPACMEALAPIPAAVLLQELAYFTAKGKGCDIDKPRNLAKSVTVE
ncbi:MAG: glutamine--fructose-6-phosphate transaminase (isomerizing) [Solobacterium sp.]|nr:glutamine--fructose-6-phosphate transaminase (isomerizing) [Solobacterium sp.]